ncbi:hypothetical protein FB00_12190 [Cellulosimicrobium funkei]|uniref:Uncharacterized protein n=1 Tax=Cellulosimicrobium funkei TaxID=264251 RepID=A0A0H2L2Q7_9MICO|nr:hypothetical protein FB00_12190 [Cellulosimicrobium funkei]
MRVVVGEDHAVATAGAQVEPLEVAGHALGREPRDERVLVDEGPVDVAGRGGDEARRLVDPAGPRGGHDCPRTVR